MRLINIPEFANLIVTISFSFLITPVQIDKIKQIYFLFEKILIAVIINNFSNFYQ